MLSFQQLIQSNDWIESLLFQTNVYPHHDTSVSQESFRQLNIVFAEARCDTRLCESIDTAIYHFQCLKKDWNNVDVDRLPVKPLRSNVIAWTNVNTVQSIMFEQLSLLSSITAMFSAYIIFNASNCTRQKKKRKK